MSQQWMICTVDEVGAWVRGISRREETMPPPYSLTCTRTSDMEFPPCLGCGGEVLSHPDGALRIDVRSDPGIVTFHPCGCTLIAWKPPRLPV